MQSSSQNMLQPQSSFLIRSKKRKDEAKQRFSKNRHSGDFPKISTTINDNLINTKVDTLDPVVGGSGIQHNLRPLLRNIYLGTEKMEDTLMDTERISRASKTRDIRITDFGLIDSTPQHSYYTR